VASTLIVRKNLETFTHKMIGEVGFVKETSMEKILWNFNKKNITELFVLHILELVKVCFIFLACFSFDLFIQLYLARFTCLWLFI
jgi:hypothetical protein